MEVCNTRLFACFPVMVSTASNSGNALSIKGKTTAQAIWMSQQSGHRLLSSKAQPVLIRECWNMQSTPQISYLKLALCKIKHPSPAT